MVFFFFTLNFTFGQHTISGNIVDKTTKEILPFTNILVRNTQNNLISFVTANENGFYTIEFPDSLTEIIIETSILSHEALKKKN